MFVWVRDHFEGLSPIASFVRLQPLDQCPMAGVHTTKEAASLDTIPEVLWSIFNRELCPLVIQAGVVGGKIKNEIVERSPEVVTNISNDRADAWRDFRWAEDHHLHMACVELLGLLMCKFELDGFDGPFKLIKMFACPRQAFLGFS